jgi:hypothetical protein
MGDTDQNLDAHLNCKRSGEQKISVRVANFNDYLKVDTDQEDTND